MQVSTITDSTNGAGFCENALNCSHRLYLYAAMPIRDHRWFVPTLQVEPEIFQIYRTTHQFYHEVQTRDEHDRYCEWYSEVAQQNRRELEKMRGDINVFSWFRRRA